MKEATRETRGRRTKPTIRANSRAVGKPPSSHSHSIVAGGFDVMSSTTRLTAGISFTIRGDQLDQVVGQARPVGGHRVVGGDRPDHDR